jgi:hypothetical protein
MIDSTSGTKSPIGEVYPVTHRHASLFQHAATEMLHWQLEEVAMLQEETTAHSRYELSEWHQL